MFVRIPRNNLGHLGLGWYHDALGSHSVIVEGVDVWCKRI